MSSVFTLEGPTMTAGPRVTLLSPAGFGRPRFRKPHLLRGAGLGYPGLDLLGALGLSDTARNIAYFAAAAAGGVALGYGALYAKKRLGRKGLGALPSLLGLGGYKKRKRAQR